MDHRRFGGEHECWNADRQGAHNGDIFDSTARHSLGHQNYVPSAAPRQEQTSQPTSRNEETP
jgi:hypothetical protein